MYVLSFQIGRSRVVQLTLDSFPLPQIILYFLAGLQPSASQFFVFLLFTFITNLAM